MEAIDGLAPGWIEVGLHAARTPWRIATDYVWWGTSDAQDYLVTVSNWVESAGGMSAIGDKYELNGNRLHFWQTSVFVGAFAHAAIAHSQQRSDQHNEYFRNMYNSGYFHESLHALYLLLSAGMFVPC